MNEYDSNRIFGLTKKIDYLKTENLKEADCNILNTCHIREKLQRKFTMMLGVLKKRLEAKKNQ